MLAGLAVSSASKQIQQFSFRFSAGAFRDDEIFESATSTPSRYILEVGRRLCRFASAQADCFVIGNPLLPLSPAQLSNWLEGWTGSPTILADQSDFPVAYLLPRRLFEGEDRLLLPLSTVDAKIDSRLIGFLTGETVERKALDLDKLDAFPGMSANGWLNPDNRLRALRLQAKLALEVMEKRPDWRRLPFAVFHPYHAGDALFVALASKRADPLLFDKQIVCSAFADVVGSCSSRLTSVELCLPPMARDGSISKYRYFVNAVEKLGNEFTSENFVVFARLLRMHHYTPFHLIDHAKFTLGDPMDAFEKTVYGQPPASVSLCSLPVKPLRILFHLNGGWPLKSYPLEQTQVLFKVLKGLGCELTVIGRADLAGEGVRSVSAGNTAALRALIDSHHLFVGADSYPLHFSKLVMGRPTVALFGSTKPCNHDAPRGRDYRALVGHLPCNTCLSKQGCPMFGGEACVNYVKPQTIVSELIEMAFEYYGFSAA
ncbi:glycosyltransferase family 9 protein [Telmatospirillum sp.]|uniref:glycosyltransferase family 9 protein n=1 Tax=Telmatospirillum sp. TaxID=2079197 RepID=UPI00283ADA42|nr:glycosyltransferase family 9 protein [Telmatospirillum sp.]MDR3441309.1 glycosyltransferase family 9 protein [Telmatospirillum sp.]